MSHVGAEAELVQLFALRRLGDGQQVLLGGILRSLDPRGLLTQHAASGTTTVAAMSRAHSVLQSRGQASSAADAQPHVGPAHRIQKHAEKTVDRACGPAATDARIIKARTFLQRIVAAGPDRLASPGNCLTLAKKMDQHKAAVEKTIVDLVPQAWESPPSTEYLAWIAGEAAALCLARERDYDLMLNDLRNALRQQNPLSGTALMDALLPARKPFRVVIAVEGTAGLTSLGKLKPGDADCSLIPVGALPERWAYGRAELDVLATLVASPLAPPLGAFPHSQGGTAGLPGARLRPRRGDACRPP